MATLVENRQLVLPGETLAEGGYLAGNNTYMFEGRIYSSKVGLAEVEGKRVHVVPLKGCYIPHVEDQVIGRITDIGISGWTVDIASPYPAMLPASETLGRRQSGLKVDLKKILNLADLIVAKVTAFDRTRNPLLTIKGPSLGRINYGKVVQISPAKIPRLIGRKGSMINMIKKETGCNFLIGQNGVVLISGKSSVNEGVAISSIYKVEKEAHTEGLTDRVKEMIKKELKNDDVNPNSRSRKINRQEGSQDRR